MGVDTRLYWIWLQEAVGRGNPLGSELLKKFGESCTEVANVEKNPKLDGRHMSMFLSPKNAK